MSAMEADIIHRQSDNIKPPSDSYRAILETAFDGYISNLGRMDISEEYRLLDLLGSKYNGVRDRIIERERCGGDGSH